MLLLFGAIMFVDDLMATKTTVGPPSGTPATIRFAPLAIAADHDGWTVAGAWRLESEDPRITGLSSLEIADGSLVLVSDYARLLRLAMPDGPAPAPQQVDLHVLTKADGFALRHRDTEALLVDADAMWVSREGAHALIRYRRDGRRFETLTPIDRDWPYNGGVEAMVASSGDEPMLLLAERRDEGLAVTGDRFEPIEVVGIKGAPTDATRLPDGRIVLLSRTIGPLGFGNWVSLATYEGGRLEAGPARRLPLSFRDNAEGITAAPLGNGATRLWIVTDDNGSRYLRTVLLAIDVASDAWPPAP